MKDEEPREIEEKTSQQTAKFRLVPSGEVVVEHHEVPPKGPSERQIHPRRPLPVVPDKPANSQPGKDES